MFGAGGHNVDTCGVDGAVTQDVGKLGDVLFDAVKGSSKELAQVMGKHLAWLYSCGLAQFLHCRPDVTSI